MGHCCWGRQSKKRGDSVDLCRLQWAPVRGVSSAGFSTTCTSKGHLMAAVQQALAPPAAALASALAAPVPTALAVCPRTVQPAASAGETLRVIIENGKFQGVMAPTTPTGCLKVCSVVEQAEQGSRCELVHGMSRTRTLHAVNPRPSS
jgi:hypothetical protein